MTVELLAPAGDRDAALAAFHYGADAIYLGLQKFSARAEAANFTGESLSEIVAFAHAAQPRRSVYVALNTLVLDREQAELVRALGLAADLGVDGLIVQDLGVARLAQRCAPGVALHASTQMAIHNVEGARALRRFGFTRVTLARELTLDEIREVAGSGLEVEVFIHGALCYAYSGLCLYSSLVRGRSGNRGRCTYPCRERFEAPSTRESGFPFSMKDLALPEAVLELKGAGVSSLKIEGRKKSALYVAATTHYYRRLLDARLSRQASADAEADIQTIFARPWTGLYVRTPRNRGVIDADVVGHRGAPIGKVEAAVRQGRETWLRFTTRRRLEKHDGLQLDTGTDGRPYGFAVDELRVREGAARGQTVFEAPAHARVEVLLPADAPPAEPGATVYCSSSQEVKQRYRFDRPRPGTFRVRLPVKVQVSVASDTVTVEAEIPAQGTRPAVKTALSERGAFEVGRRADAGEPAVRDAFSKLGDTDFELAELTLINPERRFMPVSVLNRLRRGMALALATALDEARTERDSAAMAAAGLATHDGVGRDEVAAAAPREHWGLKTDRLEHVEGFAESDWSTVDELVIDLTAATAARVVEAWTAYAARLGPERVRMALPMLMRHWERAETTEALGRLWQAGCRRWEASNPWALTVLEALAGNDAIRLTTDWPIYVLNRSAAQAVLGIGAEAFTVSPEDGPPNLNELLARYGAQATVTVYQDTPLFVSENCGRAGLARDCRADGACRRTDLELVSASDEQVRLVQRGCRTVVIGRRPFSLSRRLPELRAAGATRFKADFMWRHYRADEVVAIWRDLRAGRPVPGVEGNYERGLL